MASNSVLQWLDGSGWLILAGDNHHDEIRALALGRAAADGGVAYVVLGSGNLAAVEATLDNMEDMGAPTGYLVDVLSEDDATIEARLGEASVIVIGDVTDLTDLRSALMGAAIRGIQTAYENGAVVLAQGLSAMLFGVWMVGLDEHLGAGLSWVERVLIVPGAVGDAAPHLIQQFLYDEPASLSIFVGLNSALALGPTGEVETWGEGDVKITLGQGFTS